MNLRNPKIYSPPKETKKRVIPKSIIILFLVIIIICALFITIFFSPLFKIKEIKIDGEIDQNTISYINQNINNNIFLFDTNKIKNEILKNNLQITDVNVYRGIPGTIKITLFERLPKLIWQTSGTKYLIDEKGIIYYKINPDEIYDLTIITDNKNLSVALNSEVATINFIDFVFEINSKLKENAYDISEYQINETIFQIDAITKDNKKIIFDTTRSSSDQIDALILTAKEHKEEIKSYIDLRVEGKVYYE